ncbi:MAG: peptidase domain-containing ABC transporter, partial [Deltaproteobacteria bacterium]|nr:peptidase domain-containing ABC transporter [Deltaproteobacteria bacterium]
MGRCNDDDAARGDGGPVTGIPDLRTRPRNRFGLRRHVPVVLQQEPTECAAASLAMVLRFFGRMVSLTECRAACGSGRDGASAGAIVRAAREQGLVARGFKASVDDLASIPLPAIVHWQGDHFVVVEHVGGRHIDIADPAQGRRRLPIDVFAASFTGVVLTFHPGETFERRDATAMFTWRTYLRGLWQTPGARPAFVQVLLASIVLQGMGLLLPLFTKLVIDGLLPGRLTGLLVWLGLGMGVWIVAQGLLGYVRSLVLLHVRTRMDAHVMTGFFAHLLSLPFRYFQTRNTGDLLTRLSSNSVLRELFTAQTVSVVLDGVLVLSYLVLLMWWAPLFGLTALSIGLIESLLVGLTTPRMTRLAQHDLRAQADTQSYLVEVLSGIATVKAAGAEARALEHWTHRFWKQLHTSLRRGHYSTIIQTVQGALRTAAPLLLLLLGTQAVLDETMTLGTMLAVNALAAAFLAPVGSLLTSAQSLQIVGAHLERIADVLQAQPEQAQPEGLVQSTGRVSIALHDVGFRYSPQAHDVLSDITFTIEPGMKLGIVGPTGSG